MSQLYDPKHIEPKWQSLWEKEQIFAASNDSDKPKFYGLIEFPYPSGAGLHVGHSRPFTGMDVISRKKRMEGFNTLFPIGFDAFGLPTENFAIKTGRAPKDVTAENIATFTRQLKASGLSFDWSRVVDTTQPTYYKWTQWIFLQFFKHGLAYKKNQPINWCPKDKIGLANEEVVNGCCERCGTVVEKRDKEQWMLAITKYADSLVEGLKDVDYIERARVQQENWIGKTEGAEITFTLRVPGQEGKHTVTVFTTRPDTLFGVTFLAVSPELAKKWVSVGWQASEGVTTYIEKTIAERGGNREAEPEKTGMSAGFMAVHPVTGEEISVWITNYVMGDVGTGAIMGVPAHDERDFEFAKKYNLPVKEVVVKQLGSCVNGSNPRRSARAICVKDNQILLTFDTYLQEYILPGGGVEEGESFEQAVLREIREETGYVNIRIISSLGSCEHNYILSSKKNHWQSCVTGFVVEIQNEEQIERTPEEIKKTTVFWLDIPDAIEKLKHSASFSKEVEFIERYLALQLNKSHLPFTDDGVVYHSDFLNGLTTEQAQKKMVTWLEEKGVGHKQVNYKLRDWVFSRQRYWGEPIPLVFCASCAEKKQFQSKGEEMNPGWIPLDDSSLPLTLPEVEKYEPTDTGESPLAAMTTWVDTICPRCGSDAKRETDTMPNWAGSSWYFLRYMDPHNNSALASKEAMKYWMPIDWYNGGMEHTVLHLLYSRFWNQFLFDIGVVPTREPYKRRTSHGMILAKGGEKMSKSKGNVVNPDEMIEQFGADALRAYIMFMGPFDQAVEWDTNGLVGIRRMLDRLWNIQAFVQNEPVKELDKITHETIKKVTEDIEAMRFNTVVSQITIWVNEATKIKRVQKEQYEMVLKIFSPIAPHICEELWQILGNTTMISKETWPAYDPKKLVSDTMTIAIQVNGKLRANIEMNSDASEEEIKAMALTDENVKRWVTSEPKKVIYVKGKLVSIVV